MRSPFDLQKRLICSRLKRNKVHTIIQQAIITVMCLFGLMTIQNMAYAYERSDVKTIETIGTGIIRKADVGAARREAIANSLISSVDIVISEILPVELMTQNFKTINEIIYNDIDKYVSDYKVLTEVVSGENYRVLVQAKVLVKKMKNRLAKSGVMQIVKVRLKKVEMLVQGTRILSNFINFRKGLKEITGVRGIQVNDMQSDKATLLVTFNGSVKELTDALILKKFEGFTIRIFEVSEDKLRVELTPG